MHFTNTVALVTGGGGGIGGAIAAELARRGAKVAVADVDPGRATATVARIAAETGQDSALAIPLDVTKQEDFDTAKETLESAFGPLDILVSNAGVGHTEALGDIGVEAFKWVHDINLNASVRALHTFLPGMKARGTPAHILFTCSITALRPFAAQAAYTSAKAALLNLAMVLEMELKSTAIGVSALCPGIVSTRLSENARAVKPDPLRNAADADAGPSALAAGMKPEAVGHAAVDAIAAGKFYVFPHGDYRETVATEQRFLLSAMREQAQPGYAEPAALTAPIR